MIEQLATAAYHDEQSAARAVIFRMFLQVIRETLDAIREQCDLHIGGTGVLVMDPVILDNFSFDCLFHV